MLCGDVTPAHALLNTQSTHNKQPVNTSPAPHHQKQVSFMKQRHLYCLYQAVQHSEIEFSRSCLDISYESYEQ